MQRLECPACHGFVDEKDSECPECDAALPRRAGLPPPSGTHVRQPPPDGGDALPVAVARLGRSALPGTASPRRATAALQVARVLIIALAGWIVVQTGITWVAYREGYVDGLVPAWNVAFTVGVGFIAYGVLIRRRWARGWALGIAILNGLGNALSAMHPGGELLWIGAAIQVLCAMALFAARDEFVDGPNDGRNVRLGRVLGVLAITGSIYVGFVARSSGRGTERGRAALAAELQQKVNANNEDKVQVMASGRTLVMTLQSAPPAVIDEVAASWRTELEKNGKNAKVWVLGFERIRFTNGTHEALILGP